ncbi:MAG: hypothetical protein ABSB78_14395 [Bacteroidota bacterium]
MYIRLIVVILVLVSIALFTGCAPGGGHYSPEKPAGFFSGIWHGWIAPVTLIIGLFDGNIRIYEQYNTGWWYDFGFYIAVIGGFGGISFIRKQSKKKPGH